MGYWGLGTHSPAPVYSVDWSSFGTALTSQRANHRPNVRFKMPVPPFPRPASLGVKANMIVCLPASSSEALHQASGHLWAYLAYADHEIGLSPRGRPVPAQTTVCS